jgi:hypothetical protein
MVNLSDKLKNQLREQLVKQLYHHHKESVEHLLDLEEMNIKHEAEIIQWLSKNIWANNVSVKTGKHLRLSPEGRHLFDILVEKQVTTKAVQPLEKEAFTDHQLWIEMNRKCPVPWFLIPNSSIDRRVAVPYISTPRSVGGVKNNFRVEFYDYGEGGMQLMLMSTIGDLKQWVKFLE